MSAQKTELRVAPIIRYINSLVAKSSQQEPELLPGEMALSARFNVGRGTVRRALELLIRQKTVIRLAGRKGYFSNPAQARNARQNIGILVGGGYAAALSGPSCACMRGCLEILETDFNCIYFPVLHSRETARIREELLDLQLDALFWIAPEDEIIPLLDDLAHSGLSVISVENPYKRLNLIPQCNALLFDARAIGVKQGKHLLKKNCLQICTLAPSKKTWDGLLSVFEEAGHTLGEESFINVDQDMIQELTRRLDQNNLQAVICPGPLERYQALSALLSGHPNGKKVRILVEPEPQSRLLRSRFPELCYEEAQGIDVYKSSYEVGKRGAKLLLEIREGKKPSCIPVETYI
jgi:DNA-binding LacI/PurR family transcriptional regulator